MITNLYMKNNKLIPKAQSGMQVIPFEKQADLNRFNDWDNLSFMDKYKRRMNIAGKFIQESPSINNIGNAISAIFGGYDPENPMLITGIAPTPGKYHSKAFLDKVLKVKDTSRNFIRNRAEAQAAKDYAEEMGLLRKTKLTEPTKPKLVKKPNKKTSQEKYLEEKAEDANMGIFKRKRSDFKTEKFFGTGDGRHLNAGRHKEWERKELYEKILNDPSHPLHSQVNRLQRRILKTSDANAIKAAKAELKNLLNKYLDDYHKGLNK